jgi:hypothetical protein
MTAAISLRSSGPVMRSPRGCGRRKCRCDNGFRIDVADVDDRDTSAMVSAARWPSRVRSCGGLAVHQVSRPVADMRSDQRHVARIGYSST